MKNTHTGDRFEILYIYIYIYTHTHIQRWTTKFICYMVRAADNQETQSHILAEPFINIDP